MKSLIASAVVALAFIQFRSPADNSPLFVLNEDAPSGCTDGEDGYARDAQGNKLPIGVRVYGPGSKVYRAAEDEIADASIKAGKKALTGASLRNSATFKLASCTQEFVNFAYALTEGGDELTVTAATEKTERLRIATAFYEDLRFVGFRDQVEREQHDLANFTQKGSAT